MKNSQRQLGLDLDLKQFSKKYGFRNQRLLTILTNLSKIYKKCTFIKTTYQSDNKSYKYQFRFLKDFTARQYLLVILETDRLIKKAFGGLLIDLSKAFGLNQSRAFHCKVRQM